MSNENKTPDSEPQNESIVTNPPHNEDPTREKASAGVAESEPTTAIPAEKEADGDDKTAPSVKETDLTGNAEEVEVEAIAAPANVEPVHYTLWEKINPAARRKRQMNNMHEGYMEILGLVRSMRENLDHQVVAQKKLISYMADFPAAVDGLKSLSQSSSEHTEMLKLMQGQLDSNLEQNRSMSGSVNRFNDTLVSMDQTTKQLVTQSRDSELELRRMLRRAQRRIAFMTFILFLLLLSAIGALGYVAFREEVDAWLARPSKPATTPAAVEAPVTTTEASINAAEDVIAPEPAALPSAQKEDAPDGQTNAPVTNEVKAVPVDTNQGTAVDTATVVLVDTTTLVEKTASNEVEAVTTEPAKSATPEVEQAVDSKEPPIAASEEPAQVSADATVEASQEADAAVEETSTAPITEAAAEEPSTGEATEAQTGEVETLNIEELKERILEAREAE